MRYTYLPKSLEGVVQRCSVKKVFLEISQNSQENTCASVSFLIKLQAVPATLLKKRPWHRCFPVNFLKFLQEHLFTQNTSGGCFWGSRSKDNQIMIFGQLIEHNMRNIFLEKLYKKCGGETIPRFFSKKAKLSISLQCLYK